MIDLSSVKDTAKAKKTWLIGGFALLCIILLIKSCTSSSGPESSDSSELDRFFEVNRGDFNITILARGELEAIKNYEIKFTGKGKLGLFVVSLLDDKTEVKAGDTVLSLDNVSYLEEIKGLEEDIYDTKVSFDERLILEDELLETSLRNLEEDLDNSVLNISLFLEDQNIDRDKEISSLTEKTNAYETAQDALVQYKNLDYRSKSKGMQADIDTKEQAYFEATDELEKTTQALSEARLKDEDTREKAERNVLVAEKKMENAMDAWENARRADRQFRRYDHPQTLRKLNIAAEKTELDLKQNLVQAQSKRVQAERRYKKLLRDKETIIERIADRKEKYSDEVQRERFSNAHLV
jgi:hypothetical protein